MMKISPVNPVVHQAIKKHLIKDTEEIAETFYDYDNSEYALQRSGDNPDVIKFGFSCQCYKQIMENGGQEMLDELYKDHQLPGDQQLPQSEVTLAINAGGLGKTESK